MTPDLSDANKTVFFHYQEDWNKGLRWWERLALMFQRVYLTYDGGHFIATKMWRGKIYVVAESENVDA